MLIPLLALLLTPSLATPLTRAAKPVYWLLAGDSTTAPDGGWGDAFLATTVAPGSSGHNYGHSGATTKSFRAGGDWANVIGDVKKYKEKYDVYVTIQFGHNDQKTTSGVTIADFKTNLATFARETSSAGATPIILTSLTRRNFNATTGRVIPNLADVVTAATSVAQANNLMWFDLNNASMTYVNAIGKEAAARYNWGEGDWTHLNPWGGVVFARVVSDGLVGKYGDVFGDVTRGNETLSRAIREGRFA